MVIAHRRTYFLIWRKAPTGRLNFDTRWLERIVGRKEQLAPVLSTLVRRTRRTAQYKVPLEHIVFTRTSIAKGRRVFFHHRRLFG